MSYERRPREMHDATCGDCGKQCQVPFEPKQDKPVYCTECFQKHKPESRYGSGGGRFGGRGGSRGGDRGGFNRRPREMHKATCGDCGNECEVPFEPRQDKPVYCTECFQKHKPQNRGGSRFDRGGSRSDRGGSGFNRRPREMHKATCGDCGNECEVPFEPRQDKPVYCTECFQKHRSDRR